MFSSGPHTPSPQKPELPPKLPTPAPLPTAPTLPVPPEFPTAPEPPLPPVAPKLPTLPLPATPVPPYVSSSLRPQPAPKNRSALPATTMAQKRCEILNMDLFFPTQVAGHTDRNRVRATHQLPADIFADFVARVPVLFDFSWHNRTGESYAPGTNTYRTAAVPRSRG